MDFQVVYNTPHHIPLGVPIALYFYMTGLSAGSFVISVIATIGGRTEFKPIGRLTAVLAPVLLMLAPLNLIYDLEQKPRFWHLFTYFNPTSPITYGSFLLTLYPMVGVIYAYFLFKGITRWARFFGVLGVPIALATHGYTGFILALGKRPLWSTSLMPTLFIVSAMVSGIALVIVLGAIRLKFFSAHRSEEQRQQDAAILLRLSKIMAWTIVADLFLVVNEILVLATSHEEERFVLHLMLFGRFSRLFVGTEVLLGGLLPMTLLFVPFTGRSLKIVTFASVLVLVGIFAMRVVVVLAGQSVPLH